MGLLSSYERHRWVTGWGMSVVLDEATVDYRLTVVMFHGK